MTYKDRFLAEYEAARVNLTLTDDGYERYVVDLYPDKLAVLDMVLHLIWAASALFFAFRVSTYGAVGTLAASLGGMVFALLLGRIRPLGIVLGAIVVAIGIALLPTHIIAGPVGLFGLNSVSKRLSNWYARDVVKRWCLGSEQKFLQSVAEGTIVITAGRYATDDTREFLRELAAARPPAHAE